MQPALLILIAAALAFDFFNGFNDSGNIVATAISSRAMTPRTALMLSAAAEFAGPFLFGVAIATTIGRDLVAPNQMTLGVLLAAVVGAIAWALITWYSGIPSSSSHALIGGIVGAALASQGAEALKMAGLFKVLSALLVAPMLALFLGYLVMKLTLLAAQGATPAINSTFKGLQFVTMIALALSHGTNDGQKTMGLITLALFSTGNLQEFVVPSWVVVVSAAALALGVGTGGWRVIRTVGGRIYRIRPVHAFTSQLSAGLVMVGAALAGGPVSASQVMSSAVFGVGSAERLRKVHWGVAQDIVVAWLITIPASALVAAGAYWVVRHWLP